MPLYALRTATLDGLSGQGYVFPVKSGIHTEYHGVFFPDDQGAVAALPDADPVPFSGMIYRKTRESEGEVTVDVTRTQTVGVGMRADFRVVEGV